MHVPQTDEYLICYGLAPTHTVALKQKTNKKNHQHKGFTASLFDLNAMLCKTMFKVWLTSLDLFRLIVKHILRTKHLFYRGNPQKLFISLLSVE